MHLDLLHTNRNLPWFPFSLDWLLYWLYTFIVGVYTIYQRSSAHIIIFADKETYWHCWIVWEKVGKKGSAYLKYDGKIKALKMTNQIHQWENWSRTSMLDINWLHALLIRFYAALTFLIFLCQQQCLFSLFSSKNTLRLIRKLILKIGHSCSWIRFDVVCLLEQSLLFLLKYQHYIYPFFLHIR